MKKLLSILFFLFILIGCNMTETQQEEVKKQTFMWSATEFDTVWYDSIPALLSYNYDSIRTDTTIWHDSTMGRDYFGDTRYAETNDSVLIYVCDGHGYGILPGNDTVEFLEFEFFDNMSLYGEGFEFQNLYNYDAISLADLINQGFRKSVFENAPDGVYAFSAHTAWTDAIRPTKPPYFRLTYRKRKG